MNKHNQETTLTRRLTDAILTYNWQSKRQAYCCFFVTFRTGNDRYIGEVAESYRYLFVVTRGLLDRRQHQSCCACKTMSSERVLGSGICERFLKSMVVAVDMSAV
jgi:hypothetical protein